MKSHSASDKKIFYGLVVLIVLTVLLIVGITYIQRPQTTSSDAQVPSDTQLSFEANPDPTSIPLPEYDNGGVNVDESANNGVGDNKSEQSVTVVPDQTGEELIDSGAGELDPTASQTEGEPVTSQEQSESSDSSPTTETTSLEAGNGELGTTTPTAAPTSAEVEPSPTDIIDTLMADSGTDSIQTGTAGTGGTDITYTTSTPVPTAGQLPVAGTVHITLLIFAASLLLVVLGLAL